ncbi:MAG: hypothetical protein AB8G17_03250 [Gammaproteobacteria bacterium]
MQFSEVFLRLGSGLVAWLLLLTYIIWLGVVGSVGCGPDGDELHRLVLGLAPVALGSAFLLRATRPLAEVHGILRWGAVVLAILVPAALHAVWGVFRTVWLAKTSICGSGTALVWEQSWPVVHVATLVAVAFLVTKNWKLPQP